MDELNALTRADGDGLWGQLNDSYFLAEGSKNKLDEVFQRLEKKYGKPVFGVQGQKLTPISNKAVPVEVLMALKNLSLTERSPR